MDKVRRQTDMCERPLLPKILMFSLPLVATGILQYLYNAADIIVVGRYAGHAAMAAVGSTGSLVSLITGLFIGLSVGALSSMSRWVGAKDERRADAVVHTALVVSVIGGIAVGVFGFFAAPWLLKLMDTPDTVLPMSSLYMKIYFAGMPFMTLYNFGGSVLRACGDTRRPLYILAAAGLVNVGLNYALVVWADMSVAGVAVGTTVSQVISAVAVVWVLMRRKGYGKFFFRRLRIDRDALREIVRIGLSAGVQSFIFSLSNTLIQASVNSFGDVAMAGNAAASNLDGFVYIAMNALSQACLTFTAQNYGAKKPENIRLVNLQCHAVVFALGIVMSGLFVLFARPLLSLYNKEPEVIELGVDRIYIVVGSYFLCGLMEVAVGGLRGMGRSFLPLAASVAGVCGIRIVWIYTAFAWERTLIVLYLCYPVSWLITLAIEIGCYVAVRKKVAKKLGSELSLPEEKEGAAV